MTVNWWSQWRSEILLLVIRVVRIVRWFMIWFREHDLKWWKLSSNCDCGRFMKNGNNVLWHIKLPMVDLSHDKPNIDHGSGLERIAAAVNNDPDVFKISYSGHYWKAADLSGKSYATRRKYAVIADHWGLRRLWRLLGVCQVIRNGAMWCVVCSVGQFAIALVQVSRANFLQEDNLNCWFVWSRFSRWKNNRDNNCRPR